MDANQNWTSKFQSAFRDLGTLSAYLGWAMPSRVEKIYPVFVPKALADRMKEEGPEGILAREFYPHTDELVDQGYLDPIGDKKFNIAPQLIHRYPSRVLFTATSVCPVNCRYCFRKNELSPSDELFDQDFEKTLSYLREHQEISEIIFTGGDPLTLSDSKIDKYLSSFATIAHIKDVRFHTRWPVIIPERIDEDFIALLNKWSHHFRTVSVAVHANHVKEFSCQSRSALQLLASSKAQILSQTVLLKGVNDSVEALTELMEFFVTHKVRPYYLHHPDQVRGGMHFYLSLEEGRAVYASLRKNLPGWAIPQYVIDVPGGHGKTPAFNPESLSYSGELLSLSGEKLSMPEPVTQA
ncbi:MAG: KamA family radical SAM protein [Bacteriovoracaceae bacterium]